MHCTTGTIADEPAAPPAHDDEPEWLYEKFTSHLPATPIRVMRGSVKQKLVPKLETSVNGYERLENSPMPNGKGEMAQKVIAYLSVIAYLQ